MSMRASYNGITQASQACDEGSTPFARSSELSDDFAVAVVMRGLASVATRSQFVVGRTNGPEARG